MSKSAQIVRTPKSNGNGEADLHTERVKRATKAKPAAERAEMITIEDVDFQEISLHVIGESPLLMNAFSNKAKQDITATSADTGSQPQGKRTPQAIVEDALYRLPNGKGYYMPASCFRRACVEVCTSFGRKGGISKKLITQALRIVEGQIPLLTADGSKLLTKYTMHDTMGRNPQTGGGVAIFRPMFENWSMRFVIRYNARAITPSTLVKILNTAGQCCGVGDWRHEKMGSFGYFKVSFCK